MSRRVLGKLICSFPDMPSWSQSSFFRCRLPAGVAAVLAGEQLWEQEHTHAHQWSPCQEDLYPPYSRITHPICSSPPALGMSSLVLVKMEYSAQSWREVTALGVSVAFL